MSTTNYKEYLEKTLKLAHSLIIKSEDTALTINRHLDQLGYEISDDLRTWKYYLNLAGIPHFLDKPMYVSSYDTKETIEFTISNLKLHPITKKHYHPSTNNFKSLATQYPTQETLMRGILNPTKIEVAIASPDYTILAHDKELIEYQETNVLGKLQTHVTNFGIRWHNPSYILTDDLYLPAHLASLFMNIPTWLAAIRLENAKTYVAHSFHIKEYLRSHGKLDRHYDYLTISQALFLYRNILYIENNAGKQETFRLLIQRLLTDRNLGIYEFNLKVRSDDLLETQSKDLLFLRTEINSRDLTPKVTEFTLPETLNKERPLALSNVLREERVLTFEEYSLINSKRDNYKTKLLESVAVDLSDSGIISFTSELIKYWALWSNQGKYNSIFTFINPLDGRELTVNAKESFLLFMYLFNKSNGVKLTKFPELRITNAISEDYISLETLKELVPVDFDLSIYEELLGVNGGTIPEISFNYTFSLKVREIYDRVSTYIEAFSLNENMRDRGYLEEVFTRLMPTQDIAFNVGFDTYQDWFLGRGLNLSNIGAVDAGILATSILTEVSGIGYYKKITVEGIQAAMLSILKQLSSYNVQYAKEINSLSVPIWDRLDVRVGDVDARMYEKLRVETTSKIIVDSYFRNLDTVKLRTCITDVVIRNHAVVSDNLALDLTMNESIVEKRTDFIRWSIPKTSFKDVVVT